MAYFEIYLSLLLNEPAAQLIATFKNQHQFSRDYSPLYTSLFGVVAGWLEEGQHDPVGSWLIEAAYGRRPLDVSILLAAGLHRDILLGVPELSTLAQYYPSVGGKLSAGYAVGHSWYSDQEYKRALHRSILTRRDHLRAFIQSSQVQTNETGRGISWLLPILLAGWPRVHLLDLGASAGLNLVADRRSFQFINAHSGRTYLQVGEGKPVQFEVRSSGDSEPLSAVAGKTPAILSRLGCDINPFLLRTHFDELTLTAFVWADQTTRLERLREGIAAYKQVNKDFAPVELHAVDLPVGLPDLLEQHVSDDTHAVICYNTFIRMYLSDKGIALRHFLAGWASKQACPVVWIQWEPPSRLNDRLGPAPEYGWLAWTIDMWFRGEEYHWHVGWVHPHGQQVHWLPGLNEWINKARSLHL